MNTGPFQSDTADAQWPESRPSGHREASDPLDETWRTADQVVSGRPDPAPPQPETTSVRPTTPVQDTAVEPTPVEPPQGRPAPVQPPQDRPMTVHPVPVQPPQGRPAPVQAPQSQAVPAQPPQVQPVPVQPPQDRPTPIQPTPIQPIPAQPPQGPPAQVQPESAEPAPAGPRPVQTAPVHSPPVTVVPVRQAPVPPSTPDAPPAQHVPSSPEPLAPEPTAPAPHLPAPDRQPPHAQDPAGSDGPPVTTLGVPPHSGSKPPLYPPEPAGTPAVRSDPSAALIPDMVVDGAAHGPLTVRAASVRGDSHRYQSEPRQDSLAVTRIGAPGDELLLLAVADGVGSAARSHVGSQQACQLAATSLDAMAEQLAAALRASDHAGFAELADRAVHRMATVLAHDAQQRGVDPAAYATTLRVLLVPLDPAVRIRGFLAVGDGGTALLREGRWYTEITEPDQPQHGMIDTRTAALPYSHTAQTVLVGPARPGDVWVLCTDGLSTPLSGDAGMRDFLGRAWGGPQAPAPADFLWQVQYRVKSYDDDRTAVVLWEGPR
ncbi:protein phosphatase 2C domain-containing protein [Streptomyces sp. NPDC046759]|uniref:PP2C family serine/threonine-protein phosphatase n=1 Tax=Streptomyces sp. NPDC046759 TaxID=3155019 RepID=UPI0033FE5307